MRELPWLPFVLSALGALGAAAMRPRAFDELCRAFIVGLGAFVTFSVFFSPQFALWFVPPAALCGSTLVLVTGVAIQWATFAYAPIASHLRGAPVPIYRAAMTAATIMRALFIGVALVPTHAAGGSVGGAQDLPNGPTSGGGRLPKIRSSPA